MLKGLAQMMVVRVGLIMLLVFLPAVCRCHILLHHHDDHVHVLATDGWTHVPVVHEHHHGHHHHHHHGEQETDQHEHGLLSLMVCEHDDHDCNCPPLMTSLQPVDELPRGVVFAWLPVDDQLRPADAMSARAKVVMQLREHIPRPPATLLRQHCALTV